MKITPRPARPSSTPKAMALRAYKSKGIKSRPLFETPHGLQEMSNFTAPRREAMLSRNGSVVVGCGATRVPPQTIASETMASSANRPITR